MTSSLALRQSLLLACISPSLLLAGCTAKDNSAEIAALQAKVAEIAALQANVSTLQFSVDNVASRLVELEQNVHRVGEEAFLDTASKGYDFTVTKAGPFAVSLKSVTPYSDGMQVTILVGNPYAATFAGFEMKVTYGPRLPTVVDYPDKDKYAAAFKTFQAETREKTIKMTDLLHPGSWTPVTFVVAPADPKIVTQLRIALVTNEIRLSQRR